MVIVFIYNSGLTDALVVKNDPKPCKTNPYIGDKEIHTWKKTPYTKYLHIQHMYVLENVKVITGSAKTLVQSRCWMTNLFPWREIFELGHS